MIEVKSSMICGLGHCVDGDGNSNLLVRFPNRNEPPKLAEYKGAGELYDVLRTAESVGKEFIARVRDRYPWRYVNEWTPACHVCQDSNLLADGTPCPKHQGPPSR